MSKHYIAMAGLHGCLPNYVALHESKLAALTDLADMHELGRAKRRELLGSGSVELSTSKHGNEYAEVIECDCSHPEQHDDAQEGCGGP